MSKAQFCRRGLNELGSHPKDWFRYQVHDYGCMTWISSGAIQYGVPAPAFRCWLSPKSAKRWLHTDYREKISSRHIWAGESHL